MLQSDAFANVH